jgi:hypothetical protein
VASSRSRSGTGVVGRPIDVSRLGTRTDV